MNTLSDNLKTGTLGELLVQLRLLQYDVQAAPPLKDSGNDLIAIKGPVVRAIQVKTTFDDKDFNRKRHGYYDLIAFVRLRGAGTELRLDDTEVHLMRRGKDAATEMARLRENGKNWRLSQEVVARLWGSPGT